MADSGWRIVGKSYITGKLGFTLIEILIVMGVILILAGIILPSFRGFQDEANFTKAHTELSMLKTGVESFRRYHNGILPYNITDDLINSSPQILNEVLSDPFQTSPNIKAKTGFTYGFITENITGFGTLYIIYSQGSKRSGYLAWDSTLTSNIIVSLNNGAIAVSNAPVR